MRSVIDFITARLISLPQEKFKCVGCQNPPLNSGIYSFPFNPSTQFHKLCKNSTVPTLLLTWRLAINEGWHVWWFTERTCWIYAEKSKYVFCVRIWTHWNSDIQEKLKNFIFKIYRRCVNQCRRQSKVQPNLCLLIKANAAKTI